MANYTKILTIKLTETQQQDLISLVSTSGKNQSEFIRGCIFGNGITESITEVQNNENSITKNNSLYKTACRQLIDMFDELFRVSLTEKTKNKLLDIINRRIDVSIIDEVKQLLANGENY